MFKKRFSMILSVLVLVSMLISACTTATPTATKAAEPTAAPVAVEPTKPVAEPTTPPAEPTAVPAAPVTIEWWTVPSEDFSEEVQRAMVAEFEKTHPNIKVNMTLLPADGYDSKMTTVLGTGQGAPDVAFFWLAEWLPQALELEPYIAKDNFDTGMYYPALWRTYALFNGKVVAMPLSVGANFVMYNKDMFDAKGISYPAAEGVTAEEYVELTGKLADSTNMVWGSDRPRAPFRAIWFSFGAQPHSDDNMTVDGYLNSDAAVKAYQWAWDLVKTNGTPSTSDLETLSKTQATGPVELFLANRIAMSTLNQGHMLAAIKAGKNFGIMPEPYSKDKGPYVNAWSLSVGIYKGSKNPDAAWEFLKYWAGPEGQKFLMDNGTLFPSIPTVLATSQYKDNDAVKAFFKVLELPNVNEWRQTHKCNSTVVKAAADLWDMINLQKIERDGIEAQLDSMVPAAQTALDECRAKLITK
ncbi:MAG TPA: extracellular solute-binding protein [Anaerolineaceae bacterium]|nr:extracellular solute-binding protein [Anaerolineaceae bacterium]HPN52658.1 extracellular solute-binding protein [Anaerolineaceae bacterium]